MLLYQKNIVLIQNINDNYFLMKKNTLIDYNKYQLKAEVSWSILGTSTVILNYKDGIYYELNEVGTSIWAKINTQACTLEEINDAIMDEFEMDEAIVKKDTNRILKELLNENLLEVIKKNQQPFSIK